MIFLDSKRHPNIFWIRASTRLRFSEFTQNFWVFSADFWQTFWVIWVNESDWSNLRLNMSIFTLGRLKNHKIKHLHPHFTMCMSRTRLQLKINLFFKLPCLFQIFTLGCETECVTNLRDKTQIFTQTNRSWLRFYSEFLCKNLVGEVSVPEN